MFDFNKTIQLIKGAMLEPHATWQSYRSEASDWKLTARDLTLPLIVGALILTSILSIVFRGSFLYGSGVGGLLFGIVAGFVGFLITAFILAWLAGAFGGSNDFDKAFAAVSLTAVPSYAGVVLGVLPWIGGLLSLGFAIYALVLLYRIIPEYLAVPQGKRVSHFICSMAAILVVSLVIAGVFGVSLIGAFADGPSS